MNELQQWWQSLVSRERIIVAVLGVLVVTVLFKMMIWQPIHQGRDNATTAAQNQYELLQWMQQRATLAKQLTKSTVLINSASKQSITQRLNATAAQAKININRFQSSGENNVQVWLENADLAKVFLWLETLQQSQGIVVENIAINETDTPGFVSVRLTLVTE
jgi:general secretion pathway protein M